MNSSCRPHVQYLALFYDNESRVEEHLISRWEVYATISFTFEMFRRSAISFAERNRLTVDIATRVYCG